MRHQPLGLVQRQVAYSSTASIIALNVCSPLQQTLRLKYAQRKFLLKEGK